MNTYSQCEECEHPSICNTACLCIKSIPKTKCSCEEPQPNYPEMVWCDKCGYEMPNVKYCTCSPDPKCRIKSNKVYCNDCNLERK